MPEETVVEKTLSEKIYFEDANAKVTNVRVTCRHLTVPIEKVGSVNINYKAEAFSLAIMCLVISCSPFLFFPIMGPTIEIPVGVVSVMMIIASLIFVIIVFNSYVELIISVGGRRVKLMGVSMKNKAYIEEICIKISDAILDEQKYRDAKLAGNLESTQISASDTMKLKKIIDDYEDFKKMKEEFEQKKKK